MNRRKEIALVTAGILAGIAISGPAAQAAAGLMANTSNQKFYLDGQRISLTAYEVGGSNYVKLRDIGKAVDFGVTYDTATNTVTISPGKSYEPEVTALTSTAPAISQTSPSGQSKNADGSINVPQDSSQYVPKAGDVIRCDDGTNYIITDVSRYDRTTSRRARSAPCLSPPATGASLTSLNCPRRKSGDSMTRTATTSSSGICTKPAGCSTVSTTPWARMTGSCRAERQECGEMERHPHPPDPDGRYDWRSVLALAGRCGNRVTAHRQRNRLNMLSHASESGILRLFQTGFDAESPGTSPQ